MISGLLFGLAATAQTTYFSYTDATNTMPSQLYLHHSITGCTGTLAPVVVDQGAEGIGPAGKYAIKSFVPALANGCESWVEFRWCDPVKSPGTPCNPALDADVYIDFDLYFPSTTHNGLDGSTKQLKVIISRWQAGTQSQWTMDGSGGGFTINWGVQEDAGSDGLGTTTWPIVLDSWVHIEEYWHRTSATHLGHDIFTYNGVTSWDKTATHLGGDDPTSQQYWSAGSRYAQNSTTDAVIYITNIRIATNSPSSAPPTAVLTAPTAGTQSGTITVSGTCTPQAPATCASGQFQRCDASGANCVNLNTSQAGVGPYSISWDTNTFNVANFPANTLDGNYTVGLHVTDSAAGTGDAVKVGIVVKNAITPRPAVRH